MKIRRVAVLITAIMLLFAANCASAQEQEPSLFISHGYIDPETRSEATVTVTFTNGATAQTVALLVSSSQSLSITTNTNFFVIDGYRTHEPYDSNDFSFNEGILYVEPYEQKNIVYNVLLTQDSIPGTIYRIRVVCLNRYGEVISEEGQVVVRDFAAYYRNLGNNSMEIEASDVSIALSDWSQKKITPISSLPISTTELLSVYDEWQSNQAENQQVLPVVTPEETKYIDNVSVRNFQDQLPVTLTQGERYRITWNSSESVKTVTIAIERNGQYLENLIWNLENNGEIIWTPDYSLYAQGVYQIVVTDVNSASGYATFGKSQNFSIEIR